MLLIAANQFGRFMQNIFNKIKSKILILLIIILGTYLVLTLSLDNEALLKLSQDNIDKLLQSTKGEIILLNEGEWDYSCKEQSVFKDSSQIFINNKAQSIESVLPSSDHKSFNCFLLSQGSDLKTAMQKNSLNINLDKKDGKWLLSGMGSINEFNTVIESFRPVQEKDKNFIFPKVINQNKEAIDCAAGEHQKLSESNDGEKNESREESVSDAIDDSYINKVVHKKALPQCRQVNLAIETSYQIFEIFRNLMGDDVQATIEIIKYLRNYVHGASVMSSRDLCLSLNVKNIYIYSQPQWRGNTSVEQFADLKLTYTGKGNIPIHMLDETMSVDEAEVPCLISEFEHCISVNDERGLVPKNRIFEEQNISAVLLMAFQSLGDRGRAHFGLANPQESYGLIPIQPANGLVDRSVSSLEDVTLERGSRDEYLKDFKTFAHELGHLYGSEHTRCYDIDRCGSRGDGGLCTDGIDEFEDQISTVMSYCSETEFAYHPVVSQKINEKINDDLSANPEREDNIPLLQFERPSILNLEFENPEILELGRLQRGDRLSFKVITNQDNNWLWNQMLAYEIQGCTTIVETLNPTISCTLPEEGPTRIIVKVINKYNLSDERVIELPIANSAPTLSIAPSEVRNFNGYGKKYTIALNLRDIDHDDMNYQLYIDEELIHAGQTQYRTVNQNHIEAPRVRINHTFRSSGQHRVRALVRDSAGNETERHSIVRVSSEAPVIHGLNLPEIIETGRFYNLRLAASDRFRSNLALSLDFGEGFIHQSPVLAYDNYNLPGYHFRVRLPQNFPVGQNEVLVQLRNTDGRISSQRRNITVRALNRAPQIESLWFDIDRMESKVVVFATLNDSNGDDMNYQFIFSDGRLIKERCRQSPCRLEVSHALAGANLAALRLRVTDIPQNGSQPLSTEREILLNEENEGQNVGGQNINIEEAINNQSGPNPDDPFQV